MVFRKAHVDKKPDPPPKKRRAGEVIRERILRRKALIKIQEENDMKVAMEAVRNAQS